MRKRQLVNALEGPLFGPWTREAVIFRHNRELDDKGREALYNDGNEVSAPALTVPTLSVSVFKTGVGLGVNGRPLRSCTERIQRISLHRLV